MGSFARARRLVPREFRLRVSFWTSVGVVAGLFVLQACWREREEDRLGHDSLSLMSAKPRRLISDVYPNDLVLSKPYYESDHQWLIVLHIVAIGYMLTGLNTVCDIYFTGALEVLVEEWKIQPDVAGATFMAAGGSMPELFTSMIGVWVESDVGFSTIVGSAVFNVLFVIGLCGYAAKKPIKLSWWPLFRDCSYYIISLVVLASFCKDKEVQLVEAVILFCMYLLYCIMMTNNQKLQRCFDPSARRKNKQVTPEENTVDADVDKLGDKVEGIKEQSKEKKIKDEDDLDVDRHDPPETYHPQATPEAEGAEKDDDGEKKEEDGEDDDDDDDEPFGSHMQKPKGTRQLIQWYLSMPVYMTLWYGIPEPTKKWFLATFLISLAWIAGFSFILVWCVEILGDVAFKGGEKASIVMGFTILAAGTSIPDLVSSVAVAVKGYGDMAVSSSIGSNIFDILFGLPVPWIVKLVFRVGKSATNPVDKVTIHSDYIFFYVLLLLGMVFLTITSIHFVGWQLNKTLGLCMAGLYGVFLTTALIVEFRTPEWLKF